MCKHLWVDNGWYCGLLSDMQRCGFKFHPKTDVVSCRLLNMANWEITKARWDADMDYIPF